MYELLTNVSWEIIFQGRAKEERYNILQLWALLHIPMNFPRREGHGEENKLIYPHLKIRFYRFLKGTFYPAFGKNKRAKKSPFPERCAEQWQGYPVWKQFLCLCGHLQWQIHIKSSSPYLAFATDRRHLRCPQRRFAGWISWDRWKEQTKAPLGYLCTINNIFLRLEGSPEGGFFGRGHWSQGRWRF